MVFDLGGTKFCATILSYQKEDEQVQILSNAVDLHFGGEDFDNALVDYILKKTKNGEYIRQDTKAIRLLKDRYKNAKKILSNEDSTFIWISNIYKDIDIRKNITRDEFEKIYHHLFDKLFDVLKKY